MLQRLQTIILEAGFQRLTMDEICRQLACSKSSLYAISASKDGLIARSVVDFFDDAVANAENSVRDIADPTKQLTTYVAVLGSEFGKMSRKCYFEVVAWDVTRDVYVTTMRSVGARLRQYIRGGVESGAFRDVNPLFVSNAVALVVNGIQGEDLLCSANVSAPEAYGELAELLVVGLIDPSRALV